MKWKGRTVRMEKEGRGYEEEKVEKERKKRCKR
jgi:hypothetical protein